jgi:hypothetical protein
METTPRKHEKGKGSKHARRGESVNPGVQEMALQERVEHVRDLVEDLRDRAEIAFHERPYLLPVATGALGLGVGVLIGSKLSRILLLTAAGAMLSDQFRAELIRASRRVLDEIRSTTDDENLGRGFEEDIADVEPSM